MLGAFNNRVLIKRE